MRHGHSDHEALEDASKHRPIEYPKPDGKISFRDKKGGAGNLVVIRHDGGLTTQYMHLSKFAKGQKVGDTVKARTVIGYVGMTGLATGPHLHFGVQKNGRYVDPTSIESVRGPGVAKADRPKFIKQRDRWSKRLEAVATATAAEEAGAADATETAEEAETAENTGR